MAKFIDLNYPGIIYDGLAWLGGSPSWISDHVAFKLLQKSIHSESLEHFWMYRSAPAFWADNDGQPE